MIRPPGVDGGGLDENEARAADRPAAEMDEVPVVGKPSRAEYWHMGETRCGCEK